MIEAGTAPSDLLTLLIEARDPQTGKVLPESDVAGSIITFIGAGHETTANTLAWSLFLLAKHPDARAAVEAEIDAEAHHNVAEWPQRLPLTTAVIEEAMRLYPPAPIMSRMALNSDEIFGKLVPKGSTVIIAPYIVHRHKLLWDEPDYFRPERFLPGKRETIPSYAFMPFGAGPRVCIGQAFSQLEAVIILATLLRSLRFSMPANETVFPVHHVTLRPTPTLKMNISVRR
jgi:cytochrome P450